MLSHALWVVHWLLAFRTCMWKQRDFSPSANWSPSKASVTWPFLNSDSMNAIECSDNLSIWPGAKLEGRIITSDFRVKDPSISDSDGSSDDLASISIMLPSADRNWMSSSYFIITDIRCSYVIILASSLRRLSSSSFHCVGDDVDPSAFTCRWRDNLCMCSN